MDEGDVTMVQRITPNSPVLPATSNRFLTNVDFARLAEVPAEIEWFANLDNAQTRRAYENALKYFMGFTGIIKPEEFREVTRAHIIAWRNQLTDKGLSGMTIRHRLAALSSLFELDYQLYSASFSTILFFCLR
jgi:integrase/recombinase XerD